ncbi:MAG: right-handed parallel beta-helix repeat-containing protein, partial [Gemmatimonadetes bacterium]|nr:right-handed parallel beta-helix repeat-containing protein [Gemmatimonadota bacterium]
YGTGRAKIIDADGVGLYAHNTAGLVISQLIFEGYGADYNKADGILFYNDLPGNVKLAFVRIQNVETAKFGRYGVAIGGANVASGFRDVRISNLWTHDNGDGGLLTYGKRKNVNQNVYVGYSRAFANDGHALSTLPSSGNGIVLGSVDGGTIERCLAYGNGTTGKIPNGVWAYDSNNIVIQYNESYGNRSVRPVDGGGFALDRNVTNSVMQYNYSHDNEGVGYLLTHPVNDDNHAGNRVRFNVSQNDARDNRGAIRIYGRVIDTEIHNNTIYLGAVPAGKPKPAAVFFNNARVPSAYPERLHIRNNIFRTDRGMPVVFAAASVLRGARDLRFEGNSYYSGGATWQVNWGGTNYFSLAAWRTGTGQEKLGTQSVGSDVDPKLTNGGGGGTIANPTSLSSGLPAYRLQATSPLVNMGLNLPALFSVDPGPRDFYGNTLPQSGAYDVGAHDR